MAFTLRGYKKPDFDEQRFLSAPDAVMAPAPADSVAPTGFHAMSIFPEYFKVGGEWLLAEESRMDCVPVYDGRKILVKEPRRLNKGEQVILGSSEQGDPAKQPFPETTTSCMTSSDMTGTTVRSYG